VVRGRILSVTLCAVVSLMAMTATDVGAANIVPPANPRADLWAVPAYSFTPVNDSSYSGGQTLPACWKWGPTQNFVANATAPKCVAAEVSATDRAQRAEGLPAIGLPRNFAGLSAPEQLLVLVDIERVSRGEAPVLGVSARVNVFAQLGARSNSDPSLPPTSGIAGSTGGWAANYAGSVSPLDANYEWMYTDGWQGKFTFNYACTSPHAAGCWGHRDNILANVSRMPCYSTSCTEIMGAGFVHDGARNGFSSYTELFVQVSGVTPTLYYTWDQALAAGARA